MTHAMIYREAKPRVRIKRTGFISNRQNNIENKIRITPLAELNPTDSTRGVISDIISRVVSGSIRV